MTMTSPKSILLLAAAAVTAGPHVSHAFVAPQCHFVPKIHQQPSPPSSSAVVTFLSDIPQDDTTEKRRPPTPNKNDQSDLWKELSADVYKRLPGPPEDSLTLYGDISSLFIYGYSNHLVNEFYLRGLLDSSDSADAAAKALDSSTYAADPVWLDHVALGPHMADHVLMNDLVAKLTPHFAPILSSGGLASVSMATCWLLAGTIHGAFSFKNTLDCPTERAVLKAGQTWVTSTLLMIAFACSSHFIMGGDVAQTSELMGRGSNLAEQWLGVLSREDLEFIFGSLGIMTLWRFLISSLLGGWSK